MVCPGVRTMWPVEFTVLPPHGSTRERAGRKENMLVAANKTKACPMRGHILMVGPERTVDMRKHLQSERKLENNIASQQHSHTSWTQII